MGEAGGARGAFLRGVGACYGAAFAALGPQAAGLFGPGGLVPPARGPALARACAAAGVDLSSGLEAVCVLGTALAFAAAAGGRAPSAVLLLILYALYAQVFECGGVFLGFQWDILLMECGFAAIFLAHPLPRGLLSEGSEGSSPPAWTLGPWLVCRFVLFKLMFMSGVVKLTSRCPTWLGLTACHYHWATQPLATSLAWALHSAPGLLKKLSVAATLLIEIAAPFLMLSPSRGMRALCATLQALLQVSIILSGNYCFFNALTLVLTLTLFDRGVGTGDALMVPDWAGRLAGVVGLAVAAGSMFRADFPLATGQEIDVRLHLSVDELERAVEAVLPPIMAGWIALVSLLGIRDVAMACVELWQGKGPRGRSVVLCAWRAILAVTCPLILVAGILPFASLSDKVSSRVAQDYPAVVEVYRSARHWHVSGGYGLFRRMTGVGDSGEGAVVQRPEIEVLGSMDGVAWTAYTFKYKPGPLDRRPPFVAPLQPRLDWQMWFASLGHYHQNPWFIALMYRLVTGSEAVLSLLDETSSFMDSPPKFIKADLYHYTFTSVEDWQGGSRDWWKRTLVKEYFPAVTADNASLREAARSIGILKEEKKSSARGSSGGLELGTKQSPVSEGEQSALATPTAVRALSILCTAAAAHPSLLHAASLLGFLMAGIRSLPLLKSRAGKGKMKKD